MVNSGTWSRRVLAFGVLAIGIGVVVACGSSRPGASGGDGTTIVDDGTCNTEGATRSCHFVVPNQPGMLVCGEGTQACQGGTWSPCNTGLTGNSYTLHPEWLYDPTAPAGKQLRPNPDFQDPTGTYASIARSGLLGTATLVTNDAGTCTGNACDPNCLQIPIPGVQLCGYIAEKPREAYTSLNAAYQLQPPDGTCVPAVNNCGYDATCQPDLKCRFNRDSTQTCLGIDLTVGESCDPGGTNPVVIPICNRGGLDATSGVVKLAWSTTATNLSGLAPQWLTTANTCSVDLSVNPIKTGKCVNVDKNSCPALPNSGNIMVQINNNGAGAQQVTECLTGYRNNWGAVDMGTSRKCSFSCNSKDSEGNDRNYNDLPGGLQQNPATCNIEAPTTTSVAGTPAGTDPAAGLTLADNCNFDFQCVNALGKSNTTGAAACTGCGTCQTFNDKDQNHCVGVDLTAGVGCNNGDGIRFRVCNRGSVDFNGSFDVGLDAQNQAMGCTAVAPGQGNCTFNRKIEAGECVTVSEKDCPGWNASGNRMIHVDPNNLIAECDECNNWSEFANNDSCAQDSLSTAFDFQIPSSCPPGYIASWGKLFYNTSTPGGSSIQFAAQTSGTADGGPTGWAPATPVTVANVPNPDQQVCTTANVSSPPNNCPKDMTAPLGTNAKGQFLNLTITMNSNAKKKSTDIPQLLGAPIVMFDCVPNE